MILRSGLALAAMVLLAGTDQTIQAEPMENTTLRVLTFNIKHGATMNGDFDLDVIAGVIRDAEPDLVALQEVDLRTRRARGLDLATELAQRTKLLPAFGAAMPYDGGEYGVAILSRFTYTRTRRIALPFTGDNEPRVALEALFELPDGEPLRFVSTHLDSSSASDRLAQAEHLNEQFGESETPTVLAGDFNAPPDSKTMAALTSNWIAACGPDPPPTFPSDAPRIKIDYVLFRPAARWEVGETRVIPNAVASDHCAYLAVLTLKGK